MPDDRDLRKAMRQILGEFYNFGPAAYEELADPAIDALLRLPRLARFHKLQPIKDLGMQRRD